MSADRAAEFADDWIADWNAHDLERILTHYADDVEMSSPYVAMVVGERTGAVKGIHRLRDYWTSALAQRPHLQFELLQVFVGVNSVALVYRSNLTNKKVVETFKFDANGKVVSAHAYSESS